MERGEVLKAAMRARRDFEFYCRMVLGIKPVRHQKEWVECLQALAEGKLKGEDGKITRNLLIIAPPGSGKTQLVGVGYTAWMIGRNPFKHYGLISYADKVAWSRSVAIRNMIEHDRAYKLVFPEEADLADEMGVTPVVPDKTNWSTAEFRLLRERFADPHPTLRAGGATSAVVAYRLDGLVIDDPMDQKNSSGAEARLKVFRNYESAILTRLTSEAWQVCIGTRWADDDFLGYLIRRKRDNFRVVNIPALNHANRTYWPQAYPQWKLDELRHQSPELFELQYMGDTSTGGAGILRQLATYPAEGAEVVIPPGPDNAKSGAFRRTYRINGEEKDLLVGIGWDCAMKEKEKNDWTVGYVGGLDKNGQLYILERYKGHWGLPELLEQMYESYEKWRPFCVWIEDASGGTPAIQTLMAEAPHIPVVPILPTQGGKRSRGYSLQPHIHSEQILFPQFAEWFEDAQFFLLRFPNAAFDDDLDALFILANNLLQVRHPASYGSERSPRMRIVMK